MPQLVCPSTGVEASALAPFKAKFVSLSDVVVSNTTAETSILGTGIGTLTTFANTLPIGVAIALILRGTYTTRLTLPGTMTVRVKSGSTVTATAVLQNLPANLSSPIGFEIRGHSVVRSIGVNGSVMVAGVVNYMGLLSTKLADDVVSQLTTIDTTVDRSIGLTAQWSVADPANVLTVTQVVINTILPNP